MVTLLVTDLYPLPTWFSVNHLQTSHPSFLEGLCDCPSPITQMGKQRPGVPRNPLNHINQEAVGVENRGHSTVACALALGGPP